jgi:hypothetical protein
MFVGTSLFSQPAPQPKTISGQVIAYSVSPACLNGSGYWSVLIYVEHYKNQDAQRIRVDFSLLCGKDAEWISSSPMVKSFRLVRDKDADVVLSGCLQEECQQNQTLPIWKRPPAVDPHTLPFGQKLPSYRSVDLPMAPVV